VSRIASTRDITVLYDAESSMSQHHKTTASLHLDFAYYTIYQLCVLPVAFTIRMYPAWIAGQSHGSRYCKNDYTGKVYRKDYRRTLWDTWRYPAAHARKYRIRTFYGLFRYSVQLSAFAIKAVWKQRAVLHAALLRAVPQICRVPEVKATHFSQTGSVNITRYSGAFA
jgi:hypothetical protein